MDILNYYGSSYTDVVMIGCGAVGRCILELLLIDKSFFKIGNLTIIEPRSLTDVPHLSKYEYRHMQTKLTAKNLGLLNSLLAKEVLVIDVSVEVDAIEIMKICEKYDANYINTSLESWEEEHPEIFDIREEQLLHRTLHHRMKKARELFKNSKTTMIVDHGMNPGLISHMAKQALSDKTKLSLFTRDEFNSVAKKVGLKTIVITEKDTQISYSSKPEGQFRNTWSCLGFYAEGVDPVQIGGFYKNSLVAGTRYDNMTILPFRGVDMTIKSHVAVGNDDTQEIHGFMIPHGEANTLSQYFDDCVVYYAYKPCNDAVKSFKEVKDNGYKMLPRWSVLSLPELKGGYDSVGALLHFQDGSNWYCGTILYVKQVKKIGFNYSGPTTVQVAISMCSAIKWMLRNRQKGFLIPENLPYDQIIKWCKPYLGTYRSESLNIY